MSQWSTLTRFQRVLLIALTALLAVSCRTFLCAVLRTVNCRNTLLCRCCRRIIFSFSRNCRLCGILLILIQCICSLFFLS